jgi:hypothetical protein
MCLCQVKAGRHLHDPGRSSGTVEVLLCTIMHGQHAQTRFIQCMQDIKCMHDALQNCILHATVTEDVTVTQSCSGISEYGAGPKLMNCQLCLGLTTSVVAKEYNIGCIASTQRVCQPVSDNPDFTTACSPTSTTMCTHTLMRTTSSRCGHNVPQDLQLHALLSSRVCTLMFLLSLTLRVAYQLMTSAAL